MLELYELNRIAGELHRLKLLTIVDAHDVGEYVQRHLSGDLGQTLHQELRRPHAHLQRGEGMFGRLARCRMVLIEALLYFLQYMLMLPACDSSLLASGAKA